MVAAVGGDLVARRDDAPDYVRRVLREIGGAEKSGLDLVSVEDVKYAFGAVAGNLHPLGKGELHPALSGHVEFFGVETK